MLNAQQAAQPLPAQGAASGRIGIGDAALILVIPQHSDLMEELASSSEGDDQEDPEESDGVETVRRAQQS